MRTHVRLRAILSLLCAGALASCDGSPSGPSQLPESELVFVRAADGAPPLATRQVQVWAKSGEGRRIEIPYARVGEYGGDKCLEFTIPGDGLLTRPDGTPFVRGDSVLITIRVVDPNTFNFEFSPSGLRFNAKHPAELRISYKWADPDLNGDGSVDDDDGRLGFDIWKQETPASRWEKIGTSRDSDVEELRANVTGFTKYAMAGGV